MDSIIWLAAAAVLAIIEALTLGLSTIWFAGGAVIAAIAAILGASTIAQIFIFLGVSAVLVIFTRPVAQRKLKIGKEKTNVETAVGQTCLVTEDILPYHVGQVKLGGQVWSAVGHLESEKIEAGVTVKVLNVEGVKLIVERAQTARA